MWSDNIGKVWQGDCLEMMKSMPDKSISACISDPPYGINYQSAWRSDKTQWKPKIANDERPFIDFIEDLYRVMKDDSAFLCFTRYDTEEVFREEMRRVGFVDKAQVIWDKVVHGMGDLFGDFAPRHENIIFAVKGNYKFPGDRPTSVFRYQRVSAEKLVHPNEKPLALMTALLGGVTKPDDLVFDPFMGSWSLALAAKQLGRRWIGAELSAKYCAVGLERLRQEVLL